MKSMQQMKNFSRFTVTAVTAMIIGACATAVKDPGADRARASLSELRSNAELASRAPVAINDAEQAVRAAETPREDAAVAKQLAYVAEQKVAIARAQAERRYEEDKVKTLSTERAQVRLEARTAEADSAKLQADAAREQAQSALEQAEMQKEAALQAMTETEALRRQIAELNAKPTDRGLVMTLGDVLFATGRAELQPGALDNLGRLVQFLNEYPERSVVIEGHTDSVGSDDLNLGLSQRRSDSVRTYLLGQGIEAARVTATGKGERSPIASNDNAGGRQQNRRVEIIISN